MSRTPTKLTASTELVVCRCGAEFLAYKKDRKQYCSRPCQDRWQARGSVKGMKFPRPDGWAPSEKQLEHVRSLSARNAGRALSAEHKERLRATARRNWQNPDYRSRVLASRPEMSSALRRFHRERMIDLWASGFYDDKPIYVRSGASGYHNGVWMRCLNSEGVFARELDFAGIAWQYEPRRFRLSWCSYTPDFYLPEFDLWVEVKGFLTEDSARKIDTFRDETGKALVVVMQRELPTRIYGGGPNY